MIPRIAGALAVCCSLLALHIPEAEARRVALVIGNAAYKLGPLQNPVNDASTVAAALEAMGFDKVILRTNLGVQAFRAALAEMARESTGADLGVVYFAGHGTEVAGRNFLIPVDATLSRASALDLEAIPLDVVLAQLEGVHKLKLVILDACRNNPFAPAGVKRAVSRGLAPIEPEDNTLIVYAAKDGTTADDGTGRRHSPFTEALLKHIATPGLEVNLLFRRVRDDVIKATSHEAQPQQPHVYASLGGQELYLSPSAAATPSLAPAAAAPSSAEVVQLCESIAKNPSLSVVQSLLGVYRGTPVAKCIEARIEELSRQVALTTAPPGVGAPASPPIERPAPASKEPEKGAAPLSRAEGLKCCIDLYFESQGRKFAAEGTSPLNSPVSYSRSTIVEICNVSLTGDGGNTRYSPAELCRLRDQARAARAPRQTAPKQ
jgi:hypothetical protein